LHGLFECTDACTALLTWAGLTSTQAHDYPALHEAALDRLAATVEQHLDTESLLKLLDVKVMPV
jgi:adenosylcobyric acid synthase